MKFFQNYPVELESMEASAIAGRRAIVEGAGRDTLGPQLSTGAPPPQVAEAAAIVGAKAAAGPAPAPIGVDSDGVAPAKIPADTVGLALSGGGIRSSTFCLGFLQAMAQRGLLRHVDILSTVSGGGYVGCFLGRFYDRLRPAPATAPDVVESAVANAASAQMRYLRDHGEYIAPAGKSDLLLSFAIFLRNFLTLQFALGLLGLGLYGLANTVRYGLADQVTALLPYLAGFGWSDLPLGHLVQAAHLGAFWSPWFIVFELVFLLAAFPQALGYWLASQDEAESYSPPALFIAFLLLLGLLWASVRNGFSAAPLIGAVAVLLSLPTVEWAWHRVRQENIAVGTGGARVQQLRARTHLSRDLGMWLAITGIILYLALIDTAGHAFYEAYVLKNSVYAKALAAVLVAVVPVLRAAAQVIGEQQSIKTAPAAGGIVDTLVSLVSRPSIGPALAVLLMVPPFLLLSLVDHAIFGGGGALWRGVGITVVSLALSLIIALPWANMLVNRCSLQSTFAARIARAFLGASNPSRAGAPDDDVQPGDDVDVLTAYRPFEAGGPLHLINVCVNQTVDSDITLRNARGRGGLGMACSPLGVSIGKFFHARWNPKYTPGPMARRLTTHTPAWAHAQGTPPPEVPLKALGHVPGTSHPLLGADENPPADIDLLPLRDWISISGAAVGPGMGMATNPALSLLFLLANVRVGYWWDSGLTAGDRGSRPRVSFVRRVLWLLTQIFNTQARLVSEATAAFRGPWDRFWYLSDGGHFENLGGYELIRRRVPFIIMLDGDCDPTYAFIDFANFQRKIRIDFQAELEPITPADADTTAATKPKPPPADAPTSAAANQSSPTAEVKAFWDAIRSRVATSPGQGGPLDQLVRQADASRLGTLLNRHAILYRVKYGTHADSPDQPQSLLLYVKASLTGDEPTDVEAYRVAHPDFPHESTADQFFDEPQWESYRRLGEHVGGAVLGPLPPKDAPPPGREGLWMCGIARLERES